jgi:hypothetical protein
MPAADSREELIPGIGLLKEAQTALAALAAWSPCPYARAATTQLLAAWPDSSVENERVIALRRKLIGRCMSGSETGALAVRAGKIVSVESLATFLHTLLRQLRIADGDRRPFGSELEEPGWDFALGDDRWFITTFAPFYPPSTPAIFGRRLLSLRAVSAGKSI